MTTASTSATKPPSLGYTWAQALTAYAEDRLGTMMRCAHAAPVVQLSERHYVVSSPEAVMDVLRRTGQDFRLPEDAAGDDYPGVRGNPQYDAWMGTRKLFSELLRDESFVGYVTKAMGAEAIALGESWAGRDAVIDPFRDLMDVSARSAARAFFGLELDERSLVELTEKLAYCAATERVNNAAAVAFKPSLRKFVPRLRRQSSAFAQLEATIEKLVDQAQSVSFAGVLNAAGKTRAQIAQTGITLLRAGTEGTSGAFSMGLHALADGVFTADDLLDPARAPLVLRETLRMWPPIVMIRRQSLRDVVVEGYSIPGGSEISISSYATQRTAPDYVDPEVFRPERWIGLHPHAGAWIPYGAGPQWCVGQPLAEAESAVVLPALAERFIFRRNGPMESVVADARLHPVDETLVVVRRGSVRDQSTASAQ